MTVTPWAASLARGPTGGTSVVAIYGPLLGGAIVVNPYAAADQELAAPEVLYVNLTGPAALAANGATFALEPGQTLVVPRHAAANVWVNAASSGHAFSAVAIHESANFVPFSGAFPPPGPTTVTKVIPAFLYQEYNDDDDLQAFFRAFNELSQEDVDWFVEVGLPLYPGLSGGLLDRVAAGLYGMLRPALPTGRNRNVGPLNTWGPNALVVPLNVEKKVGNQNFVATTDDVFKRILTWHFFKGDGKVFTVPWLKRRVMRFLFGAGGVDPGIDNTYPVSVTFGAGNEVDINLLNGKRTVVGGALPNRFGPNSFAPLNSMRTTFASHPPLPLAATFKAAVDSGALELPFQFTYVVNIK